MFETFKCAQPECKGLIGRTKFGALKPDYVHALRDSPLNTCTCQQHENADRAIRGLRDMRRRQLEICKTCDGKPGCEACPAHGHLPPPETFNSLHQTWELALCPRPEGSAFHDAKCLNGTCATCGKRDAASSGSLFKWSPEELADGPVIKDPRNLDADGHARELKIPVTYDGSVVVKDADGNPRYKPAAKTKNGGVSNKLVEITKCDLISQSMNSKELAAHVRACVLHKLPSHEFRRLWQQEQFKRMQAELPLGWLLVCMDFSENMDFTSAGAAQSCHWTTSNCTLHIACVWRHAVMSIDGVESTAEHPIIVKERFNFVSDDNKHDLHFVFECQKLMLQHYKQLGVTFPKVLEWTDGCASQYKCENAFGAMTTDWEQILGTVIVRHYFEVRCTAS